MPMPMSAPGPDFSRKAALSGALVRLVPARREHAAVLHPLLADPEVGRLTGAVHSTAPGHDAGPAWTEDQLAEVYAFNPRARHVYEQAGFVHEGTLRDALLIDGTWVDAHVMGILADEWRERHGRS